MFKQLLSALLDGPLARRLDFIEVGGWSPKDDIQPPHNFKYALNHLQEHPLTKTSTFRCPATCPHCASSLRGSGYNTRYTHKGWSWTDLDREHILFAHVPGESQFGYFVPHPAFVTMVMDEYPVSDLKTHIAPA